MNSRAVFYSLVSALNNGLACHPQPARAAIPNTSENHGTLGQLPVENLANPIAFYKSPGFTFNPQSTYDTTGCLVIPEQNYAMLLTR